MRSIAQLLIGIMFVAACTDFSFVDAPENLTIKAFNSSSLPKEATSIMYAVESGEKWEISSRPVWVNLVSIEPSNNSPYEWNIVFNIDHQFVLYF